MDSLIVILMSWAVTLSGYNIPSTLPKVYQVPHEFFVQHACGGNECKVRGWYAGGGKVYIDNRMDPQNNLNDASIVVHEFVHYLQYETYEFPNPIPCEIAVQMEKQAYGVQQAFFTAYGSYAPQSLVPTHMECV